MNTEDSKKKIQEENNILANDVLERNFYTYFRQGNKKLEIYLLGNCKANCSYCYLKKHQKDLYPVQLENYDNLIKNFQMILNWYVKNHFTCPLDFFSAEWLTTPLAPKVFDCLYNTFSTVPSKYRPKVILAADNMQFLKNNEATKMVEDNISRLDQLNIKLILSASVEGKVCEYDRTENDDEFYDKLKIFMTKYNFLAHPMISADNIKYWIENYKWWSENFPPEISDYMMTLEVRDNNWTDEAIDQLLQYCDFMFDTIFKRFNYDKHKMLRYVLNIPQEGKEGLPVSYNVISLSRTGMITNKDKALCSIGESLAIRVGDLSVSPCHRLFYPELSYGKYNINNDEIANFEAQNVELLIMYAHLKRSCMPKCERCKFQGVCVGNCHGASYETYHNPLIVPRTVCRMYKSKLTFLIYKYQSAGILEVMPEIKELIPNHEYQYFCALIKDITGESYE